ncbi:predicted protein [Chaetomium globosum CBS 148.51]|uniref:Uncharacterized protein n=1 Tax=Chaetomium globosum (strain ATCC 6205 / CBS 148.51 / DSM 1962 / NBRC 6347 / NRRL 1970) TaxID=306901 RepID=Q2H7J1_CHAGB|nr:uncharacterized protein CHGG_05374 [Chaetomium globosum CBS 148.51]EAQ88755.1 predicted protein [Chaetomium globosum CBS 148.51]
MGAGNGPIRGSGAEEQLGDRLSWCSSPRQTGRRRLQDDLRTGRGNRSVVGIFFACVRPNSETDQAECAGWPASAVHCSLQQRLAAASIAQAEAEPAASSSQMDHRWTRAKSQRWMQAHMHHTW